MLWLAAAVLAASAADQPPVRTGASARATAMVRIVSAVRLKLDGSDNPHAPTARDSEIRSRDGTRERARLIEFQ